MITDPALDRNDNSRPQAQTGLRLFLPVVWEQRMTQEACLELTEHVVAMIEKVHGIPSSEPAKHDLVKLIEDLGDTALVLDREEPGAAEADDQAEQP
jgi:hypothetical protein